MTDSNMPTTPPLATCPHTRRGICPHYEMDSINHQSIMKEVTSSFVNSGLFPTPTLFIWVFDICIVTQPHQAARAAVFFRPRVESRRGGGLFCAAWLLGGGGAERTRLRRPHSCGGRICRRGRGRQRSYVRRSLLVLTGGGLRSRSE